MKCTVCGIGEYRWVHCAERIVFCTNCGMRVKNMDGKIPVVGKPPKEHRESPSGH